MDHIIVKYGEIALKGKNKPFFEKQLMDNIIHALKGLEYNSVKKLYGRVIIKLNEKSDFEKLSEKLKKVLGIVHFSPASIVDLDIEKIKQKSLEFIEKDAKTFHVKSRRSNKSFPLQSPDINREVGKFIEEKTNLEVNFEKSDFTIFIEITEKGAFIYNKKFDGLGGLPVGVTGKVISLISGGIDSPVASFQIMKRGCEVIFVHFHNLTTAKAIVKDKVKRLIEILSQFQPKTKLYLIPFGDIQKELVKTIDPRCRMIVYRRAMFKIAEKILIKENAKAFVTGDSLAQVASQTLENIQVIQEAANYPVLSPLIGSDKEEIIELSEKIGTYETSILPYSDCCSMFIAEHPETRSKLENVKKQESDITKLVDKVVKEAEIINF
ncbi:MAG: tRNA uracil 4-sulfurtransferase ThiI [Candidatus Nanoarchaeia archaeon]|nr:tRNA uracil 4-sulfurtransferase ThiI [Candidatus Nanoarchaeia archaeon]